MKIEVLGTGCQKCTALAAAATAAVQQLGLDCEVEKVTDITQIMAKGVMMTPALVVDGEVKASGKLLSVDQIKAMIGSP
jgi:small redox-active disulfide protein 2